MSEHPADDGVSRPDIMALGAARGDLGKEYEPALLESFADRVERAIDARVAGELARRESRGSEVAHHEGRQLALGIVSLVAFIPLSIPLGVTGNWFPLLLVLAAIVGVNATHAWLGRRQPPRR